jgi:hypothetical protein
MLTDYHKNRYKWAFDAQREFIDSFVVLNIQENADSLLSEDWMSLDQNGPSFHHLTALYKETEKTRKQVFEEYDKEIERFGDFIKENNIQIEIELKETTSKENQLLIDIKNYKEFLTHVENMIKDIKAIVIIRFVNEIIPIQSKHKKASFINGCALKLEQLVKTKIKKQISDLKEISHPLPILSIRDLQLPELDSIPEIQQKMDSFWFNNKYQKSLQMTRDHATVWVEKMYSTFINLLSFIHNEGTQHIQQLLIEKEALQQTKNATLLRLQNIQANDQEKRDLLIKQQKELNTLWKQDCEHAKRLPAYFIKHWLLYKEELEQKFLHVSVEERWFVSQYLLLLQQDGEKIIEPMNIGDE